MNVYQLFPDVLKHKQNSNDLSKDSNDSPAVVAPIRSSLPPLAPIAPIPSLLKQNSENKKQYEISNTSNININDVECKVQSPKMMHKPSFPNRYRFESIESIKSIEDTTKLDSLEIKSDESYDESYNNNNNNNNKIDHLTQIKLFSQILNNDPNNQMALLCRAKSRIALNTDINGSMQDLFKAREIFIKNTKLLKDLNDLKQQNKEIKQITKELISLISDKLQNEIIKYWNNGDIMNIFRLFQNIYDKYPNEIYNPWIMNLETQYRNEWKYGYYNGLSKNSEMYEISNKFYDFFQI